MVITEHPIFRYVRPYFHVAEGQRANIDLLDLPEQLIDLCLGVVCNCVSCGAVVHVFRRREKSLRARTSGAPEERRLFYSATCPSSVNKGCSRTNPAGDHKETLVQMLRKH